MKSNLDFLEKQNYYEVLEMPALRNGNSIRMEIDSLKLFCNDRSIPLFCLNVGENVYNGIPYPVETPYKKFFTIYQDWCFFAVVHLDKQKQDAVGEQTAVIV